MTNTELPEFPALPNVPNPGCAPCELEVIEDGKTTTCPVQFGTETFSKAAGFHIEQLKQLLFLVHRTAQFKQSNFERLESHFVADPVTQFKQSGLFTDLAEQLESDLDAGQARNA